MDPAQGETQGKSLTSKLKTKVKGVKGKIHIPGHKKRQGNNADNDSDYSSDESPGKPGPETGYNVGGSTPYTTVKHTPLSPEHPPQRETHDRDYAPSSAPPLDRQIPPIDHSAQQPYAASTVAAAPGYDEPLSSPSQPSPGVLGHVKQTVGGAAAAVGSKMGYYSEVENTPHEQALIDPDAPTLVEKTKATLGLGPSSPNTAAGPQQPGIVNRVSGAVTSLFSGSPKGTGEDVQHTFPAHSDNVTRVG